MAAEGLSWLARNGRRRGPRACGVASPGEESLAAAIAARRSRLAVLWPDHAIKRPRRSPRQTALRGEVADMGLCKRPGSTGEGTETLACGKAAQPSGIRPSARLQTLESISCGYRCRSIEALRWPRCPRSDLTIRIRRTPNRRYDEARPQLSLAAGAAGNSGLPPATSLDPISGGFGSARRAHAVVPTATAPISANARCHSSAGTPSWARPRAA